MAKIIAVANQKGGVGKSTTVVNLAASVGIRGKKVLCIDMDPQGNTTSGFGVRKKTVSVTVYDILIGQRKIEEGVIETAFKGVSLISSTSSLAGADIELVNLDNRSNRLKMQLLTIKNDYDYIFIDCPPSLSLLTVNALCAADSVLIPLQCEYYSLEGLSQLVESIKMVRKRYNPNIDIDGIVFTMFDSRLNLTNQVVGEVQKHFPQKVYRTVIPRNVKLSEAPSYGKPVIYYDKISRGAEAYEKLCEEMLKRHGVKDVKPKQTKKKVTIKAKGGK
ncbi:MAG: AAA family ATPase [Oscillospiraceae bacterium]|nr:AAA family ATPase [Oscillospiraceae bacterium]